MTSSISNPLPQGKPPRRETWRRRMWLKNLARELAGHTMLIAFGLFFFIPFLWMFLTSFKSDQDVFRTPPRWLPYDNLRIEVNGQEYALYDVTENNLTRRLAIISIADGKGKFFDPANPAETQEIRMKNAKPVLVVGFRWQNYPDAMNKATRPGRNVTFWTYFRNSLIIAFFSIIGTLLSCAPAAYGFACMKWPGRDLVFLIVLSTMMLPFQVTMIPLYLFFNETLHWGDSFLPIIVPTFFANAFDIFLLRQFFRTIPEELMDAARVDGASEFKIFTKIVLPLSIPVLATITLFTFLWAWNDFQGPLLYLTSPKNFTMALGLQDYQSQHNVAWNLLMAASVVFTIPIIIVFFFAQKTFIQGVKLTGLKE